LKSIKKKAAIRPSWHCYIRSAHLSGGGAYFSEVIIVDNSIQILDIQMV
jgi:hypothetical protein